MAAFGVRHAIHVLDLSGWLPRTLAKLEDVRTYDYYGIADWHFPPTARRWWRARAGATPCGCGT